MTFRDWLFAQKKRGDGIGDIARACSTEPCKAKTYAGWVRHLNRLDNVGKDAMDALAWANREYLKEISR